MAKSTVKLTSVIKQLPIHLRPSHHMLFLLLRLATLRSMLRMMLAQQINTVPCLGNVRCTMVVEGGVSQDSHEGGAHTPFFQTAVVVVAVVGGSVGAVVEGL